jgi:hypothetical protein
MARASNCDVPGLMATALGVNDRLVGTVPLPALAAA